MIRSEIKQLYKYRTLDKHSVQCLANDVIWISDPKSFNDPFEYTFHIEPDLSYQIAYKMNKSITRSNCEQKQAELIEKIRSEFVVGGIFCLSECNDISLMWSHYADGHKGFCIGYERTEPSLLGSEKCSPVAYDTFPEIKLSEFFEAVATRKEELGKLVFKTMVLSKDPNWTYEKEWRVLFEQQDQLIQSVAPIRSIIFGLKMPGTDKDTIRNILRGRPKIEYYQAHKAQRSYSVEIHRII